MPSIDHDDFDLACEIMQDATNFAVAARRELPPEAIVQKSDGSLVTSVDVALQVLILSRLEEIFGAVPAIAEEDLRSIGGHPAAEAHCLGLLREWGLAAGETLMERVLASGGLDGPTGGVDYVWILDPIDGTQGFIDGDHWCPCLALLRRGEVVFAANGHPTILGGMLLSAAKGEGAFWFPLDGGEFIDAEVSQAPLAAGEPVRVVAPARATPAQVRAHVDRRVDWTSVHACPLRQSGEVRACDRGRGGCCV
jgi:3'-phosphoadenosine 5'-phosphosulfate (PAPS) 3'-phosphatase